MLLCLKLVSYSEIVPEIIFCSVAGKTLAI